MSGAFVDDVAGIAELVDAHYEIGRIVEVDPLTSGTVNASFLVATESGDGCEERKEYVARCYRRGRSEERVHYEHHLLEYLERNGFSCIAAPIRSRDGATFVRCLVADGSKGDHLARFVAVFPRLAGEDRYSWDRPGCGTGELTSAATVLAEYHSVVSGWSGGSAPSTRTVAEEIESALLRDHTSPRCVRLERHYGSARERVRRHARDVLDRTATRAHARMPRLVIHRDFHPGNCRWAAGGVVGLLDFDWADLDLRGLDVALAAVYFCAVWSDQPRVTDWPPADADTLCLERLATFASTYQRKASVPTLDQRFQSSRHISRPLLPAGSVPPPRHIPDMPASARLASEPEVERSESDEDEWRRAAGSWPAHQQNDLELCTTNFGNAGLGPLDARERDSMPTLIALANLFVLAWVVDSAAPGERSEQDSLRYLEHHLRLMDWIAANQEPLRNTFCDGRANP